MKENGHFQSARDVSDWFQLYFHQKTSFSDKDVTETSQKL